MARKAPKPTITHVETLCYAIRHLESEVNHWKNALSGVENPEESLHRICERQLAQIEALQYMYQLETGTEYC